MKKLDDIPKKNIFNVPDGYFDHLPTRIQQRIQEGKSAPTFPVYQVLKYALPLLIVALGILWYIQDAQPASAENILAAVPTDELILYLEENNISTDELIEELNTNDVPLIEEKIYNLDLDDQQMEEAFDELQSL